MSAGAIVAVPVIEVDDSGVSAWAASHEGESLVVLSLGSLRMHVYDLAVLVALAAAVATAQELLTAAIAQDMALGKPAA